MENLFKKLVITTIIFLYAVVPVASELITITGDIVAAGEIDNVDRTNDTIEWTIQIEDGAVFNGGLLVGVNPQVTVTLGGENFVIDGAGYTPFFIDGRFRTGGLGGPGITGDAFNDGVENNLVAPNDGDSLSDFLALNGNTFVLNSFPTQITTGTTLNGNTSLVTTQIDGTFGSTVIIQTDVAAVPEPSTIIMLVLFGLGTYIRQRVKKGKACSIVTDCN